MSRARLACAPRAYPNLDWRALIATTQMLARSMCQARGVAHLVDDVVGDALTHFCRTCPLDVASPRGLMARIVEQRIDAARRSDRCLRRLAAMPEHLQEPSDPVARARWRARRWRDARRAA